MQAFSLRLAAVMRLLRRWGVRGGLPFQKI